MKAERIMTSAASALGAVTFALSTAVSGPASAQTPNLIWVASHPAQPGIAATTVAPDGTVFDPWHGYTPAEFCAAYNIDKLHTKGITGSGQTIVFVETYGSPSALADLQAFSRTFGLPAPDLTIIYPDGSPPFNYPTERIGGPEETSLDIQWAHAVAPDAKLVIIAVPSATPVENLFKGVAYAANHYPGSPISLSWAVDEQYYNSASDVQLARLGQVFRSAVSARCTVLAAAGDWGSVDTDNQGNFYPYPVVLYPASDPLVTAVGGTWLQYGWRWDPLISTATFYSSLDVGSYLNWLGTPARTEAVWKEDWVAPLAGGFSATGGGLSRFFATPDFQLGLPASLLQGRRGVPDISCNAAIDGGVLVYYSGGWSAQPWPGPWGLVGGTSASTPEVAGMVALANQLRSQQRKQPIGFLNPVLYTLPARDFNDIVPQTFGEGPGITLLDNNIPFGSTVAGFNTTVGYDLNTGLGSPNAYWFVHDLAETP